MGDELVALLKLKSGQSADAPEIEAYCRANISLSRFKVPRYIKCLTEFPLPSSGKVKKFELREQHI